MCSSTPANIAFSASSARTTVHFQTVSDKFSPHDALFNASSPDDLNDHAIASDCSIYTPVPTQSQPQSPQETSDHATAPNTPAISVERHGEARAQSGDHTFPHSHSAQTSSTLQDVDEKLDAREIDGHLLPYSTKHHGGSNEIIGLKAFLKTDPPPGTIASARLVQRDNDGESDTSSMFERPLHTADGINHSPYSFRPSTSEIFKTGFASLKPKAKLFPRPVTDPKSQTSYEPGTARQKLPPGMRAKPAKQDESRPKSSKSQKQAFMAPVLVPRRSLSRHETSNRKSQPSFPLALQNKAAEVNASVASPQIPSPNTMRTGLSQRGRAAATSERGNAQREINDVPSDAHEPRSPPTPKKANILSPEKQRLMKALQLRKKQQATVTPAKDQDMEHEVDKSQKTDSGVVLEDLKKASKQGPAESEDSVPAQAGAEVPSNLVALHGNPILASARHSLRPTRSFSRDTTADSISPSKRQLSPMEKEKGLPGLPANSDTNARTQDVEGTIDDEGRDRPEKSSHHQITFQREDASSDSDDALFEELRTAKLEQARSLSISPSPAQVARADKRANMSNPKPILNETVFKAAGAAQPMSIPQVVDKEASRRSNTYQGAARRMYAASERSIRGSSQLSPGDDSPQAKFQSFDEMPVYNFPGSRPREVIHGHLIKGLKFSLR